MFGERKKREGFGYVSESLQKRNALSALLIEGVVLISVVIGLLFALNYFGIFPVGKFFSTLFQAKDDFRKGSNLIFVDPKLPAQHLTPTPFVYYKNAKPSIEAVSDIPEYKITLQNKDRLLQLLNSWGVFGKEYSARYGAEGATNGFSINKITVHLVDKDQVTNSFSDANGITYTSSRTKISPGVFNTYVYLSNTYLKNNLSSRTAFLTFMYGLYKIVKNPQTPQESTETSTKFFEIAKNEPLMKDDFFQIVKR